MKKKDPKDKAVRVTVSLDPPLSNQLKQQAKKNKRSISGTVSIALRLLFKAL